MFIPRSASRIHAMSNRTGITGRSGAGSPCPVCESESKSCSWTADGLHFCRGKQGQVPKWKYLGQAFGDTQWALFRQTASEAPPKTENGSVASSKENLPEMATQFKEGLLPRTLVQLSEILGVPGPALQAVGVGADYDAKVWTFPEFDARGNVIGIATRDPDGEKKNMTGSRRGLGLPDAWREREGPRFGVEGHSDTAAMIAAGLSAIGRPSNTGGVQHLVEILRGLPAEQAFIVVGENDQNEKGEWPGRVGAERTAKALARQTGRQIGFAMVPDRVKDVRAWLTDPTRASITWEERGQKLREVLVAATRWVCPPARQAYHIGQKVSPTDRDNVGTVIAQAGEHRYVVRFVGEGGMAEKEFDAADLRPWPPPPDGPGGPVPPWEPFPTDDLPTVLRDFAVAAARALGSDPAMIAVPALAAAGGAIGNARTVRLKKGWSEPSILWTVVIAEPGGKKTPALKKVFQPIWDRQMAALREYNRELAEWLEEKNQAKAKKDEPKPELPPKPRLKHVIVDDITTEALAERLADNPRGLICQTDELRKWMASFDRYRGGGKGGSDRPFWLSAHDAQPAKVDRKTPDRPTIIVPRATVSLCGGVQPAVWRDEVCDRAADEDGLAARLLHAMPPDPGVGWTDDELGEEVVGPYRRCIEKLLDLQMDGADPIDLPLDGDALALFQQLKNDVAREKDLACDWERPSLAKLDKHAARIGLVLQLVDDPSAKSVSAHWMEVGIRLARWFLTEAHRVRGVLAADAIEAQLDRLERVADRNGGRLAPRDLIERNRRRYPDAETATTALDEMVTTRPDRWRWVDVQPGPSGGRPGRHVERVPPAAEESAGYSPGASTTSETPVSDPPSGGAASSAGCADDSLMASASPPDGDTAVQPSKGEASERDDDLPGPPPRIVL